MHARAAAAIATAALLTAGLAAFADTGSSGPTPDKAFEKVAEPLESGPVRQQVNTIAAGGEASGTGAATRAVSSTSPTFSFFTNQEMPCDPARDGAMTACSQALEPEVKSAPDGTIYVTAQDGTPGGVFAWRRDPGTFSYTQLDKPDGVHPVSEQAGLTGGGGDNELAIGAPAKDGTYRVYVSSLMSLVTNAVAVSTDRGATWANNPVASSFVGVDRQWLASYGESTAYLAFHDTGTTSAILLTKTTDGGQTWGPPTQLLDNDNLATSAGALGNVESNLVALPDGGVATAFLQPDANSSPAGGNNYPEVWVALTDKDGANPVNVHIGTVPVGDTAAGLFPAIAVDRSGNLYAAVSNLHGVFLSHSTDRGLTWSPFAEVSAPDRAGNRSTVFPYVVAGSAGRVALAWLSSTSADGANDANADWVTTFAYSDSALTASPSFTLATASDHVVHHGVVCLKGTSCDPTGNSRALAEVLQMGITKDGRAMIAYPDTSDGQHAGGWAWVAEQNAGPGLYADIVPAPPVPPVVAHRTSTFSQTATQPYFFTNSGSGSGLPGPGVKDGYAFDGTTISGDLAAAPGTVGHAGVIGYAANSTPGAGTPVVFTGAPMTHDTVIGGTLGVTLYVQNELADQGATELDFSLADVAPDGSVSSIIGRTVQNGDPVVGGADPTKLDFTYAIPGGFFIPAGHHLVMSMSFPYVVSSTTRLYYGDATYPSGISLGIGTTAASPSVAGVGRRQARGR